MGVGFLEQRDERQQHNEKMAGRIFCRCRVLAVWVGLIRSGSDAIGSGWEPVRHVHCRSLSHLGDRMDLDAVSASL